MKKHLTIIALAAIAFLASCSSSDQNTATVAVQDEKPKVKTLSQIDKFNRRYGRN